MGKNALIIDDNKDNLGILEQLLLMEGVDSLTINDPELFDDNISQRQFDIVFLDLEMPNANGYEMLRLLKSNTNYASTPIVAYTVHVSEINVAKDIGFDGFLGKPLDSDEFPKQLERILAGESVWATP